MNYFCFLLSAASGLLIGSARHLLTRVDCLLILQVHRFIILPIGFLSLPCKHNNKVERIGLYAPSHPRSHPPTSGVLQGGAASASVFSFVCLYKASSIMQRPPTPLPYGGVLVFSPAGERSRIYLPAAVGFKPPLNHNNINESRIFQI